VKFFKNISEIFHEIFQGKKILKFYITRQYDMIITTALYRVNILFVTLLMCNYMPFIFFSTGNSHTPRATDHHQLHVVTNNNEETNFTC